MSPVDTGSIVYVSPLTRQQAEALPWFCGCAVLAFVLAVGTALLDAWWRR